MVGESPINRMIDAVMTCTCCGARMGSCQCWDVGTARCHCKRDWGCVAHCPNCKVAEEEIERG